MTTIRPNFNLKHKNRRFSKIWELPGKTGDPAAASESVDPAGSIQIKQPDSALPL
jgi:hypothetical protein